ncbi:MAG: hypothetical protein ABR528_05360 [Pseudonocardiaceae bacterium]
MVALIAAQRPAFHLLAGDICYADPSGAGQPVRNNAPRNTDTGFTNFDPTLWTTYFATIEKSAAHTPWMFATGNHDMEALYDNNTAPGDASHGYAGHAARLDLPANGPSRCPSVYSMVYSNVAVVSLDANDLSQEIPTNAGYSAGQQLSWLTDTLGGFRADPAIDFIVAFLHHCAFATSSKHASDAGVRAALTPLFDRSPSTWSCRVTTTSTSAPTRSAPAAPPCRHPTNPPSGRPRTAPPTSAQVPVVARVTAGNPARATATVAAPTQTAAQWCTAT